ncbi:MutS-related protein [Carboxylicivirga sp. RSCT41]|uniref:lysine 5,6-aminomutase reactivase ATPase KamC n=1 Tax=Carboxylicivirga agarovorans TaxID=3417570 RepID=UPI003D32FBD6
MCINKVIEFTDFLSFYKRYKPLTPYGTTEKDSKPFFVSTKDIDRIHNITEQLSEFIKLDENKVLKIEHHLSRIDRLNTLDKSDLDTVDLQLIKKFLIHFKAVDKLLSSSIKKVIDLEFNLQDLWEALVINNDHDESFYLSSAYSKELKELRDQINLADQQLNTIRQDALMTIKKKYQIDFKGREFVLLDKKQLVEMDVNELIHEFYDSTLVKIKPAFGKQYLDKLVEKEQLLIKEAKAEKQVLTDLSHEVKKAKNKIIAAVEAVKNLDVHLAKARLAIDLKLQKPGIKAKNISVTNGRYYPLWEKHTNKGLGYTPLTVSFASNAILLSGSNMGGKTVLFKTLAFLQLLTQMGFYVPAEHYNTSLFEHIHILGNELSDSVEGLSSFGQEIYQLTQALDHSQQRLVIVDELAKTTNATEAKAILYAVLKYVQNSEQITGFFSTHFINVPEISGVSKYRMKGLDKKAYAAHCSQQSDDLNEKIGLINTFMQYEITEDTDVIKSNDALTIAGMLGLNEEILTNANNYLERN